MTLITKDTPTLTSTGGTDISFVESKQLNNTKKFVVADDALAARRLLNVTVVEPEARSSSPGGFTQARHTQQYLFPKTISTGEVTYNKVEITASFDRETTDAEKISQLDAALNASINGGALRTSIIDNIHPQ